MLAVAYRSTNETVYSAKYQIVWCPKYRRRVLGGAVGERLRELVAEVAGELGVAVVEMGVMADHVLLLVEIPPAVGLSRFVGLAKGRTSRVLRQEFGALRRWPILWTPSWFVSTVGGAPLEIVRRYVENQETAG